jgi:predicted  nucleic acid-binding Zn-ribbon protein
MSMKRMITGLVAVLAFTAAGAIALADQERTPNAEVREMGAGQQLGEANDTWKDRIADYQQDRQTLTNRVAALDADRVTATNAIAATSGANRTAMNRMQDEMDDLRQCVQSLRQMVQDLKRATAAGIAGRRK